MEKDYVNFDYLHATVKSDKLDELIAHYKTLRWEVYELDEDSVYDDVVHLSLYRPHKIENKDELQILQIYLESAWNDIGRAENNPHAKTLITGLTAGILAVILIVVGACLIIDANTVIGAVLVASGGVCTGIAIPVCVKLFKAERITAEKTIKDAAEEIIAVNKKARALSGDGNGAENEG